LPLAFARRRLRCRHPAFRILQPAQGIRVDDETVQVVRREVAHALQRPQHEAVRVERAGVFRGTGKRLCQLLFDAEASPVPAEQLDGFQARRSGLR